MTAIVNSSGPVHKSDLCLKKPVRLKAVEPKPVPSSTTPVDSPPFIQWPEEKPKGNASPS